MITMQAYLAEKYMSGPKADAILARVGPEKKKKKPVRYPTEDLDVVLGEKEKRAGMKLKRPVPSKLAMPFGEDHETNAAFLMSYQFLVVYG